MKFTYNKSDIEEILNALDKLQLTGLTNAEILTFVVQKIANSKVVEAGEESGN